MILTKLNKFVIQTQNDVIRVFNQFQDKVIDSINKISSIPYLSGNIIKGISIVGNGKDNYINTGLSYNYSGWWVLRKYNTKGLTDIFESDTVNPSPDKLLILKSLGTMTIDIEIY